MIFAVWQLLLVALFLGFLTAISVIAVFLIDYRTFRPSKRAALLPKNGKLSAGLNDCSKCNMSLEDTKDMLLSSVRRHHESRPVSSSQEMVPESPSKIQKNNGSRLKGGWFNRSKFYSGVPNGSSTSPVNAMLSPDSLSNFSKTSDSETEVTTFSSTSTFGTITATITTAGPHGPKGVEATSKGPNPAASHVAKDTNQQKRLMLEICLSPPDAQNEGVSYTGRKKLRVKLEAVGNLEGLENLEKLAAMANSSALGLLASTGSISEDISGLDSLKVLTVDKENFREQESLCIRTGCAVVIPPGISNLGAGEAHDVSASNSCCHSVRVGPEATLGGHQVMQPEGITVGGVKITSLHVGEEGSKGTSGSTAVDVAEVVEYLKGTLTASFHAHVDEASSSRDDQAEKCGNSTSGYGQVECSTNPKQHDESLTTAEVTELSLLNDLTPPHVKDTASKSQKAYSLIGTPLVTSRGLQDGLDSLQIPVFEAGSRSKSLKELGKKFNVEIAAALAALEVDTDRTKQKGTCFKPAVHEIETVYRSNNATSKPQAGGDSCSFGESDSEPSMGVFGDEMMKEAVDVAHKAETGTISELSEEEGKRREKKRRKNKIRRQRARAAMALASNEKEIGKQVLEDRVARDSQQPNAGGYSEPELGCTCHAVEGDIHLGSCPYPFTSPGSVTQRRIKEQYDLLVQSNTAKTLSMAQVCKFTTCLVDMKASLQQKSETIQRKFSIARSLLAKADNPSYDRHCSQIHGLELEQKKLEEDTVVYNRLQDQLKQSPAYQKMLEYGRSSLQQQSSSGQQGETPVEEEEEISFEELLEQEKKDGFWQRHSIGKSC